LDVKAANGHAASDQATKGEIPRKGGKQMNRENKVEMIVEGQAGSI